MPWFVYSILSSVLFVGLYLGIRWLTDKGFAPKQILLFLIGFALLGFFGATAPSLGEVLSSEKFFSFLAAGTFAGVFSSIGHWADFEAIKRAPNPGFSTSIRNSSILPVTLFSVVLFHSQFQLLKLGGVFFILAGIIALVVQRKPSSQEKRIKPTAQESTWIPLAFIALAGYTLTVLGMKKATLLGFSPPEICLCIYIVNFLFFYLHLPQGYKRVFPG